MGTPAIQAYAAKTKRDVCEGDRGATEEGVMTQTPLRLLRPHSARLAQGGRPRRDAAVVQGAG